MDTTYPGSIEVARHALMRDRLDELDATGCGSAERAMLGQLAQTVDWPTWDAALGRVAELHRQPWHGERAS